MPKLEDFGKHLTERNMTRRQFVAGMSALGVAAAISPSSMINSANASSPRKGGRLRIGCTGGYTTDSLDPAKVSAQYNQVLNFQLRNCLVELDNNNEAVPELAESWEPSPDAVTWNFKIRKDVEFHNGKTLDAKDVVFSINHHRDDKSKSAAKGLLDAIEDIKADGNQNVIVTLRGGNADFPYVLADYHLTIVPDGTFGPEFENGIGTGAYMLKKWEPGVHSLTARNPHYWKSGRAHFDEIEMLSIVDTNARTNALKTKEIDVMDRPDLKTIHLLKKVKHLKVISTTSGSHSTIPMMANKSPYNNIDVRLALKYAIDRQQLVDKILFGYGSIGNDHPIGPGLKFHAKDLEQRVFDPDKANYHFKKAGMSGHAFKLHTSDGAFAGGVDAAILYQQSAAKAGIKIEVVREPSDGYWNTVWMKKPWTMSYWSARPTADMMFTTCYTADANWNETFWNSDKFNKLVVKARAELEEKKRAEMYYEMQQIVRDDGGAVIPMFSDLVIAATDKLGHEKIGSGLDLDNGRGPERWWFIS